MDKEEIVRVLKEISVLLEIKGDNPFKIRAYQNSARALEVSEATIRYKINKLKITKPKR